MAWKAYNAVNGQILGEVSGASGARPIDYLTDALGSVVATVSKGTLQNTYRWAGYGQQVSKTGASPDPKFLWAGGWGYRDTSCFSYVRARHYSEPHGCWITVDLQWPAESAFGYASQRVATNVDVSGLKALPPSCQTNCCRSAIPDQLQSIRSHCAGGDWFHCDTPQQLGRWRKQCNDRISRDKGGPFSDLCKDAFDLIKSRLRLCNRFGGGGEYNEDDPWAATSLCCYQHPGGWKYCGAYCCRSNLNDDPCFNLCVAVHEQHHGKDCKAGTGPSWPPQPEPCAYFAEIQCLFNTYRRHCGWGLPERMFGNAWRKCAEAALRCPR